MKNLYLILGLMIVLLALSLGASIPLDFSKFNWYAYAVLAWLIWHNQRYFWKRQANLYATLFSCFNTPSRACEDCITDERNKVVHVAFVKRGTSIDTSDVAGSLLTAELAGNAYIIRNVSGAYDGGAGTFGKGLGKQVQRLLAKKHTLTFIDFSYTANAQYWADMEDQAANFDLYFFTDTQAWVQTNAYLSIEAKGVITDDNQTFIEGSITVTWSYKSNPINYTTDVDSLATCPQLFDGTSVSFFNVSGSTGTIITGQTDEIDLVSNTSTLNARLQTGVNLSSVSVLNGTLPTGLALSYTGPYITLTGTTTQAVGTYTVTIKASNSVGIAGQKTVNFVIS